MTLGGLGVFFSLVYIVSDIDGGFGPCLGLKFVLYDKRCPNIPMSQCPKNKNKRNRSWYSERLIYTPVSPGCFTEYQILKTPSINERHTTVGPKRFESLKRKHPIFYLLSTSIYIWAFLVQCTSHSHSQSHSHSRVPTWKLPFLSSQSSGI